MQKIVYKTGTGIAVITPSASAIRNKMPMEQIIADSHIPENAEYKIIDETEMPKDYSEFKGFMGLQGALNYDMTLDVGRAKEIKKAKLRYYRKPLLEKLDIDAIIANENGDSLDDIIIEKNRLRDITNLVDETNSIEEIKAITI